MTHQCGCGEMRNVAHDGHDTVVTIGVERHHFGAERTDDPHHLGERRVVTVLYRCQHPDGAVEQIGMGTVEAVQLAARHRVPADESGVVDTTGRSGPFTLPTSVTTPTVSVSARFTWSVASQHGHGDEGDLCIRIQAGSVDHPPRQGFADGVVMSIVALDVPATGTRRARAIEPPMRPSPITLARRVTSLTSVDRTGDPWRPRPP